MKNQREVLFCAFRYALGRETYMVSVIVETIIHEWNEIDAITKKKMKEEIETAIKDNEAGHEMDVKEWKKILHLT